MSDRWFYGLMIVSPLLLNAALAWAYKVVTHGDSAAFWMAFFVLIAIRLSFAVVDAIFSALTFSLYRKKFVVQSLVNDFRRFDFPKRNQLTEDWLMYLTRVQETESLPFATRRAAVFMEGQADFAEKSGFIMGMQGAAVLEAAVNAWSTTPELAIKSQREADEREYWEYEKAHAAIRKKYDPNNEWNEATSVPEECKKEIRDHNIAHAGMLRRRNGWTDDDFLTSG